MKENILTTEITETPEPKGKDIAKTINSNSPLSDCQCVQWLNIFII